MTGRPEAPLPETGPVVPLARRLRELRVGTGMSYREMAQYANYTAPALSTAANGKKLPPRERVVAYLDALGVDDSQRAEVEQLWQDAKDQIKRTRSRRRREPANSGPAYQASADLSVVIPFVSDTAVYYNADPRKVTTFAEFSAALNQILSESGMNVAELIRRSSVPTGAAEQVVQLRKTTVYDALNGNVRPSAGFTRVFLRTCGMPADHAEEWVARLQHLQVATEAVEKLTLNPDPDELEMRVIRTALRSRWDTAEFPKVTHNSPRNGTSLKTWEVTDRDFVIALSADEAAQEADEVAQSYQHVVQAIKGELNADVTASGTPREADTARLRIALAVSTAIGLLLAGALVWVLLANPLG